MTELIKCKNCGTGFKGKFCSNCGQSENTHRITLKFVLNELSSTFIRFNSGFFYTAKWLLTNPGKTLKLYLDGKRVNHLKPFSFLVVMAGIYSLAYNRFNLNVFTSEVKDLNNTFFTAHYTQIQLLLIPIYVAASVIVFGYKKYSFSEYIIVQTYLTGQRILVSILLIPLLYYFNSKDEIRQILHFNIIINIMLAFWTYNYLFKDESTWKSFLKTVLLHVLVIAMLTVIIVLYMYL